jgi:predicted DNA-binding transcriptional regulator AlpA
MNNSTQATAPARPAGKTGQPVPLSLSIDPASMTRLLDLFREALEPMFAKAQSQVQTGTSPPQQIAEPPPPYSSAVKGVDLKPTDQIKAADLQMALLMGKIPEDTGLLIDTRTLARLLNISPRHVCRLLDEKAIPDPVRLGRLLRWRLVEILEWIEADCPSQKVWVHKRQDSAGRKGK